MSEGKHYYAFISHSSENEKIALWLRDQLDNYHIPVAVQKQYGVPKNLCPNFTFQTDLAGNKLKEKMMTPENPAVKRAFERSGGMLFADGWGEKTPGICSVPGHWMCRETASLMTDRTEWKLEYRKEENGENRIHLTGPAGETDIVMTESEGEMLIHLPVREDELGEVRLMREGKEAI